MKEVVEKKKVLLGDEEYEYTKTNTGEESLTRVTAVDKKNINVVLKNIGQSNSKDIEKYIIDVLSDLYIQRNVKRLI